MFFLITLKRRETYLNSPLRAGILAECSVSNSAFGWIWTICALQCICYICYIWTLRLMAYLLDLLSFSCRTNSLTNNSGLFPYWVVPVFLSSSIENIEGTIPQTTCSFISKAISENFESRCHCTLYNISNLSPASWHKPSTKNKKTANKQHANF